MKRILTMQDISCLGKCSITVALPIISAMGVETVVLPTAVLSTHTMFKNFTYTDLTEQLPDIVKHWKSENVQFDAIYTGYLGSEKEMEIAKVIFKEFKTKDNFVFIDPVMADNGKLYPAFDQEYIKQNAGLCAQADIIVPNITEAAFMTNMAYKEIYDEKYIQEMLHRLAKLGPTIIVVTGVSLRPGKTGVYGYDTRTDSYFTYQNDHVDATFHGTGDIFASVSVGAIVQDIPMDKAFKMASDYTAKTIEVTMQDPKKSWYGVDFETTIPELVETLKEYK